MKTSLNVLVIAVLAAALAVGIGAAFSWHSEDAIFLSSLVGLTVISEALDFGVFKSSRISVSIALIFAAGVFSGLPGAVLIAATVALSDAIVHPKAFRKAAFNMGALVLTAGTFSGVLEVFAPAYDEGDYIAIIGPAMVAAITAFIVNSGLVTIAISLDNGIAPLPTWSENFRWMMPHYVFVGVLAVLVALSYSRWDMAGLALSLVPLTMVWLVMKEYSDTATRPRAAASGTPA